MRRSSEEEEHMSRSSKVFRPDRETREALAFAGEKMRRHPTKEETASYRLAFALAFAVLAFMEVFVR